MKIGIALIAIGGFFLYYDNQSAPSSSVTMAVISSYITSNVALVLAAVGAGLILYEKGIL